MSELGPIDPTVIQEADEKSKDSEHSWIGKKIAATATARVVKSSYEALKAAGAQVICLAPWGDHSSPLLLPNLSFQNMTTKSAVAATGGTAAIVSPVINGMEPEALNPMLTDSVSVALGLDTGFDLASKVVKDLISGRTLAALISSTEDHLTTTSIKSLTITHKHKETKADAALGFFRSSIHKDTSLVSGVKDYLSIEKGWFSPYLFASGRRPLIPRSMKPDVVFCHGPLLGGDYKIGLIFLRESATVIQLCEGPPPEGSLTTSPVPSRQQSIDSGKDLDDGPRETNAKFKPLAKFPKYRSLSKYITRRDSAPPDRRLLITVVGIKPPNKSSWPSSFKPDESNIHYSMLNGVPSIVIPAKTGCPLIAWDTLTLSSIYKGEEKKGPDFVQGIADVLLEYLTFCVDWDRITIPGTSPVTSPTASITSENSINIEKGKETLKDAIASLVAGVVKSGVNRSVKEEIDLERAGIVMFRIP